MLNIKQKQLTIPLIQNGMKYMHMINSISKLFCLCFIIKVFEFVVEQYESDSVEFEIYDEDPGKDDFIGR
jgi:hypothetical protein